MTTKKLPIYLNVFYHDDVDEGTRRIVPKNYLQECITELEIVLDREFIISYRHSIPGVTDIGYKGDVRGAINKWRDGVGEYIRQNELPVGSRHVYLLVINGMITDTVMGVAEEYDNIPIASLAAYQNIAHELGHNFGATHDDAELQYNAFGISCETYVYPYREHSRANCYRYSLKNRENMQACFADED